MPTTTMRRGLALAATAAVSASLLAACSSGEPAAEPTPTEIVIADTLPTETASEEAVALGAAASACDVYFEIDLLNSAYAGGVVKQGDMTEKQVKAEMVALVSEFATLSTTAVEDGSADAKLEGSAKRMDKILGKLKKKEDLKDLSKPEQKRFAASSLRAQKACDRAGIPLPAENVTARTSAGLAN